MNDMAHVHIGSRLNGTSAAQPVRSRRKPVILIAVAVAILVSLAIIVWTRSMPLRTPVEAARVTEPVIAFLPEDIAEVDSQTLQQTIALTGSLRPLNQTEVRTQLAGQIKQVFVREGDAVTRGQLLIAMDTEDLDAKLADRRASLEAGKAQLVFAEKTRASNLALLESGFISQAAFDREQSAYLVADATIKSLQAQVDQAGKALRDASVRAPFAGVVSERVAQPGMAIAANGKLLTLVDPSSMELEALVPAADISSVRVAQRAALTVEGYAADEFVGKVVRINPATREGTQSIPVHLLIANPNGRLKGGMFVKGTLVTASKSAAAVVPAAAVREEIGESYVMRFEGDHLAKQPVTVGTRDADNIEIVAGLRGGDKVVIGDFPNLREGLKIRLATSGRETR